MGVITTAASTPRTAIRAIELARVGGMLPPAEPAQNARVAWQSRQGLLVRVYDREGRVGLGEASPLPDYSPDTLDACHAALAALSPDTLSDITPETAVAIAATLAPPAAAFAIETALFDLLAQAAELSLAEFLRRHLPALAIYATGHASGASGHAAGVEETRPHSGRVPLSALIPSLEAGTAEVLAAIERAISRGITCIKLKVGSPGRFDHELALLAAIRAAFGPELALRLDANRAWTGAEAAANLPRLAAIAPVYIEEPTELLPRLALDLAVPPPVPIAADESLIALDPYAPHADAARASLAQLLAAGAVRALVIKPMLLGGMSRAAALAALAHAYGASAAVSHLFDGPVALSACAALAVAVAVALAEDTPCGLDRHPGLRAWPALDMLALTPSHVIDSPALGLGLSSEARRTLAMLPACSHAHASRLSS